MAKRKRDAAASTKPAEASDAKVTVKAEAQKLEAVPAKKAPKKPNVSKAAKAALALNAPPSVSDTQSKLKPERRASPAAGGDQPMAPATDEQSVPKRRKKEKKQKKAKVAIDPSTLPKGNEEEAQRIRKQLGISAADPKSASAQVGFSFSFANIPADQPSDDEDAGAAEAAHDPTNGELSNQHRSTAMAATQEQALPPPPPQKPGRNAALGSADAKARWPAAAASAPRMAPEVDADGYVVRRVYAGGMPFWYDEDAIRECWQTCGPIEDLTMLKFPDTGNFRGIVFITFETVEGYTAALEFDGSEVEGMTLVVKRCRAPVLAAAGQLAPGRQARRPQEQAPRHAAAAGEGAAAAQKAKEPRKQFDARPQRVEGYNVAFVGNVPWELNKQAVEDLFARFQPQFVRMFDDPATRKHKGFAHVHFKDEAALDKALELDGMSLMGRQIKVMYAQPSKAITNAVKGQRGKGAKADKGTDRGKSRDRGKSTDRGKKRADSGTKGVSDDAAKAKDCAKPDGSRKGAKNAARTESSSQKEATDAATGPEGSRAHTKQGAKANGSNAEQAESGTTPQEAV